MEWREINAQLNNGTIIDMVWWKIRNIVRLESVITVKMFKDINFHLLLSA